MKAFITGSSGFLGRHLIRELEVRGWSCTAPSSKEADLTRDGTLDPFVDEKFDVVFHLAAWTRAGTFCRVHPGSQWVVNQQMNTNVLAWWHKAQPQAKLIALGTSVSYPKGVPLTEDHYLDGKPIEDFYAYGMCKRMLLVGLQTLSAEFGLSYAYFVPSTLYGPGYHLDGRPLHFIYDLIRKILRGKDFGEEVVLWGDGHQKRELVYIDDFVNLLLRLSEVAGNEVVNVGAGADHSIRDFAETICEHVGFDFNAIKFDTTQYVGLRSKILDTTRMRSLTPDFQQIQLSEGIGRTIAWARAARLHFTI